MKNSDRTFYIISQISEKVFLSHLCPPNSFPKNSLKVCGQVVLRKEKNLLYTFFPQKSDDPNQQTANQHYLQLCVNWPSGEVVQSHERELGSPVVYVGKRNKKSIPKLKTNQLNCSWKTRFYRECLEGHMLYVVMDRTLTTQGTQMQWHSPKQKLHVRI